MYRLRLLSLALALAACESPTAPTERQELVQARARWYEHGGDSYSFEISRGCFCAPGRRVAVTVQNGAIVAAEYLDAKEPVEAALLAYIPTVPDLFDLIEDAFDRHAVSFVASYDPLYGYPTRIEIDYSATAADDEIRFIVRDLTFPSALGGRP